MADKDVLGHGQFIKQHRFLMDGGDACLPRRLRGREMGFYAIDQNLAVIGLIDAGQDLDDGGFARTILADQRGDLTGVKVDLHPVQRPHAGKGLDDAAQRQHGTRAILRPCLSLHGNDP